MLQETLRTLHIILRFEFLFLKPLSPLQLFGTIPYYDLFRKKNELSIDCFLLRFFII